MILLPSAARYKTLSHPSQSDLQPGSGHAINAVGRERVAPNAAGVIVVAC